MLFSVLATLLSSKKCWPAKSGKEEKEQPFWWQFDWKCNRSLQKRGKGRGKTGRHFWLPHLRMLMLLLLLLMMMMISKSQCQWVQWRGQSINHCRLCTVLRIQACFYFWGGGLLPSFLSPFFVLHNLKVTLFGPTAGACATADAHFMVGPFFFFAPSSLFITLFKFAL